MPDASTIPPAHVARLNEGYHLVGDRTWLGDDFTAASLQSSRDLFTDDSLAARRPRPKPLEVYALLAGLPFAADFTDALVAVQRQVSSVLGDRLHYWVAPANLGLEFAVFKWPDGPWKPEWLPETRQALEAMREPAFRFEIGGIQVNPDGCVVAKGFDGGGAVFRVREMLRATLPFLPVRQSGWAHVPLGRILEPVGPDRFARLRELFAGWADAPVAATDIDVVRLVHETRWYMEERQALAEYALASRGAGAAR